MLTRSLLFAVALLATFGSVSCEKKIEKLKTIELLINNIKFTIEVARTPADMAKGLMYRKSMGEHEGMIFVYKEYVRNAFWMENTYIPLSIAFIRFDGKIIDIKNMQPLNKNPVSPDMSYIYALELNQGAFERAGVKVGDRIQIPENILVK